MCLPLTCLRWALGVASVALLVRIRKGLGAAVIWAGTTFATLTPVETYDYQWVGYVVGAFGIAAIVTGLIGFCAAVWRNLCVLAVVRGMQFSILCFVVGVVLVVFGAGLLYGRSYVDDDLLDSTQDCEDSSKFKDINSAYIEAASLICTVSCPCSLTPELRAEYLLKYNRSTTIGNATDIQTCQACVANSSADVLNSTICQTSSSDYIDIYFTKDEQQYFSLASWLEEKFTCAGVCSPVDFYVFSDINKCGVVSGIPTESCMDSLKNWADYVMTVYGVLSVVLGGLLLIVVVLSCCVCCHPRRNELDESLDTARKEVEVELKNVNCVDLGNSLACFQSS